MYEDTTSINCVQNGPPRRDGSEFLELKEQSVGQHDFQSVYFQWIFKIENLHLSSWRLTNDSPKHHELKYYNKQIHIY